MNKTKCPACRTPWEKHGGIAFTCKENKLLKKEVALLRKINDTAREFWGSIQVDCSLDHKAEAKYVLSFQKYDEFYADQYVECIDVEKSAWAIDFKRECPTQYKQALEYARNKDMEYSIIKSNEMGYNKYLYVIVPDADSEFWMCFADTKKEVLAVAKKMGWKLLK